MVRDRKGDVFKTYVSAERFVLIKYSDRRQQTWDRVDSGVKCFDSVWKRWVAAYNPRVNTFSIHLFQPKFLFHSSFHGAGCFVPGGWKVADRLKSSQGFQNDALTAEFVIGWVREYRFPEEKNNLPVLPEASRSVAGPGQWSACHEYAALYERGVRTDRVLGCECE